MSYHIQIPIWARWEPTAQSFPIYDKHGYTAMQSLCATRTLLVKDEATGYNTITNSQLAVPGANNHNLYQWPRWPEPNACYQQ